MASSAEKVMRRKSCRVLISLFGDVGLMTTDRLLNECAELEWDVTGRTIRKNIQFLLQERVIEVKGQTINGNNFYGLTKDWKPVPKNAAND